MYDATPQRAPAASNRSRTGPVSPRGYPLVGHLPLVRDLLGAAVQFRALGDIVKLRLPPHDVYVLNHPHDIEHWLVHDHASYRKDASTRVLEHVLGRGLLVNEGTAWRKQRRIVQPELMARRLETYLPTLQACADHTLARLLRDSAQASGGAEVGDAEHAAATLPAETVPSAESLDTAPDAPSAEADADSEATEKSSVAPAAALCEPEPMPENSAELAPSSEESASTAAGTCPFATRAASSPDASVPDASVPDASVPDAPRSPSMSDEDIASSVRERVAAQNDRSGRITLPPIAQQVAGPVQSLYALMMQLSLDMVGQTLFGAGTEAMTSELVSILDEFLRHYVGMMGTGLRLPDWVPTPGNRRARANLTRLHAIVGNIVALRRRDAQPSNDILSRLLEARDERGRAMPDRLVVDEAVTMLLASHENTALLLTYAIMLLAQHPEAERRVLNELSDVSDRPGKSLFHQIERLPYLDAVLRETLRLYPATYAIGREALVDTKIGDCRIPRGSQVWAFQWSVQRDPRFFHMPERFRPERFVHGETMDMPRFAYFPFAGGPRICPGAQLAMVEAKVVLATLLPKLRFSLVDNAAPKLLPGITLRPKDGVPVRISARS